MVITRANYQIALRLIRSLSRFVPKANQTDHPLTNTNLFLSVAVRPQFQLPSRQSVSPPVPSHACTLSQSTVGCQRRSSCICIQTTTVNKPFLVASSSSRRRRRDVLQSDHAVSGHVIRVFDTHRIHQKRFVYARPIGRRSSSDGLKLTMHARPTSLHRGIIAATAAAAADGSISIKRQQRRYSCC